MPITFLMVVCFIENNPLSSFSVFFRSHQRVNIVPPLRLRQTINLAYSANLLAHLQFLSFRCVLYIRYYTPLFWICQSFFRFSKVYFLDLHSYGMDTGSDAIIGTQFGQTCSAVYSTTLQILLEQEGLRVAENQPFAVGYLTKHYGADTQIEAAQIELSYAYYIDHRTFGREALVSDSVSCG